MKLKELKKIKSDCIAAKWNYLGAAGTNGIIYRARFRAVVHDSFNTILREYYPGETKPALDTMELLSVLLPLLKTQIKIAELKKMIKKINSLYDLGVHGSAHLYHHPDAEIDEACEWENIYRKIFSEKISKKVHKMVHLDYYDPDTSYREDVQAFVNAAIPALQNEIVKLKEQSNDRNW